MPALLHIAVVFAAVIVGLPAATAQPMTPFTGAHGATVPATFNGSLDGLAWHLDLWPDQGFHLLRTPENGDSAQPLAGRWHATNGALVLETATASIVLTVRNAGRLRSQGAANDGSEDLVTDGTLAPVAITLPMAGEFTYFADAALIRDCATGLLHPVRQEADYLALERAYLDDRSAPQAPLFVTLDATIAMGAPMEGPDRPMVTVNRFDTTWPGESCARSTARPTLSGTVWRLTRIEEEAVDWQPPAREPFVQFYGDDGTFNASAGCNMLRGGFTRDGDMLRFGPAAGTRMACPDPLANRETRLVDVLNGTRSFAIGGRTLRLLGADGERLAALEAVYLP